MESKASDVLSTLKVSTLRIESREQRTKTGANSRGETARPEGNQTTALADGVECKDPEYRCGTNYP
jgi:hypothetical protein